MAALRAAVFPLSAKNWRRGHFLPPPPVRVLNELHESKLLFVSRITVIRSKLSCFHSIM